MRPAAVVIAFSAAALLGLGAGAAGAASDSVIVVVPRADVLETRDFDACRGFELGTDEIAVVVESQDLAGLKTRLGIAEPGLGTRGPVPQAARTLVGPKPDNLLWVSPRPVPVDLEIELGIRVLYVGEQSTLFAASLDAALGMLDKGHFASRAHERAVADLKRPHFGRGLTEGLLAGRPMDTARLRFMTALAESVNADSLRSAVYLLSYDQAGAIYRTRFVARLGPSSEVGDLIYDRLGAYAGPAGERHRMPFLGDLPAQYAGGNRYWENLILTKPGRKTAAHYVICAHYDAIAKGDAEWDWQTDPAPGADDNATGVAALLECARLVAPLDLDVGVTLVAFSGEELGLQGSDHYAGLLAPEDSVLGVINLDMLGYVAGSKRTDITYDVQSEWLVDRLAETASSLEPSVSIVAWDQTGVGRSDQASFWKYGMPGVMLSDATDGDGEPLYAHYHTLADTLGNVTIDQVRDNARLVVAYLARFAEVQADTLCDLELTDGSVEWDWRDRGIVPFVAGDTLTAVVRAVNIGGSMTEPERYSLRVWMGPGPAGREVWSSVQDLQVVSGGYGEVTASWPTPTDIYGDVTYTFDLRANRDGGESDVTNNRVTTSVQVMSRDLVLRDLHVYPNPATDPAAAKLAFEILLPEDDFSGELEVAVFDLEGRKIGGALLKRSHIGDKDIAVGKNAVQLDKVVAGASGLPPGLYICLAELKVVGGDGGAAAKCKFAVAR